MNTLPVNPEQIEKLRKAVIELVDTTDIDSIDQEFGAAIKDIFNKHEVPWSIVTHLAAVKVSEKAQQAGRTPLEVDEIVKRLGVIFGHLPLSSILARIAVAQKELDAVRQQAQDLIDATDLYNIDEAFEKGIREIYASQKIPLSLAKHAVVTMVARKLVGKSSMAKNDAVLQKIRSIFGGEYSTLTSECRTIASKNGDKGIVVNVIPQDQLPSVNGVPAEIMHRGHPDEINPALLGNVNFNPMSPIPSPGRCFMSGLSNPGGDHVEDDLPITKTGREKLLMENMGVVSEATKDNGGNSGIKSIAQCIEEAKASGGAEGVLKSGLEGINRALEDGIPVTDKQLLDAAKVSEARIERNGLSGTMDVRMDSMSENILDGGLRRGEMHIYGLPTARLKAHTDAEKYQSRFMRRHQLHNRMFKSGRHDIRTYEPGSGVSSIINWPDTLEDVYVIPTGTNDEEELSLHLRTMSTTFQKDIIKHVVEDVWKGKSETDNQNLCTELVRILHYTAQSSSFPYANYDELRTAVRYSRGWKIQAIKDLMFDTLNQFANAAVYNPLFTEQKLEFYKFLEENIHLIQLDNCGVWHFDGFPIYFHIDRESNFTMAGIVETADYSVEFYKFTGNFFKRTPPKTSRNIGAKQLFKTFLRPTPPKRARGGKSKRSKRLK